MKTAWVAAAVLGGVACGGGAHESGNGTTARPAGCAIEVVSEGVPSRPTHLLGHVVERCHDAADTTDRARCMRQLQDQACHLGATVIWDVSSTTLEGDQGLEMHAEAATYQ